MSAASKYAQASRDAAASVTVITSEEIRRQGFRTVAQILETVPGFYTTNNRSYVSLGVRGFSPLSGDNNRVLILIDGHSLNENFLDGARVGSALGIDVGLIDRVEVVRGPGSSLYGSNAMLAVVNLVTKSGRDLDGVDAGFERGSAGSRRGSLLMGHEFASGLDVGLAGSWSEAEGLDQYYPEWDTPTTNGGVADEWDHGVGLRGAAAYGDWKLVGFLSDRITGSPLGAFGSDFNNSSATSSDRRFYGELSMDRNLTPDKSVAARAYFDGADFGVTYPFAATGDIRGKTSGRWTGFEGRFRWDATSSRRFTVGAEYRRNLRARLEGMNPLYRFASGDFPSSLLSTFAQADLQLHPDLQMTVGARLDHYSTVGAALSPRGGLVFRPAQGTTLKALYGEAFRSPNQAELNVEAPPFVLLNPDIDPERIRTLELVWEQRVTSAAYATLAAYDFRMSGIIGAVVNPSDGSISFRNFGEVWAHGLELGVTVEPAPGLSVRGGYALQKAESNTPGHARTNSPRHSVRAALSTSFLDPVSLGIRFRYDSSREGTAGKAGTDPYAVVDATISAIVSQQLRLSLVGENLFDVAYAHPAGPEFIQAGHPQDGRTFRVRADVAF